MLGFTSLTLNLCATFSPHGHPIDVPHHGQFGATRSRGEISSISLFMAAEERLPASVPKQCRYASCGLRWPSTRWSSTCQSITNSQPRAAALRPQSRSSSNTA